MPKMTVIWTALPNGLTGDTAGRRARVTAYVSMRLQADGPSGKLSDFSVAAGWPGTLAPDKVRFALLAGTATVEAKVVSPPPDVSLWNELFSPSVPVTSHTFDDHTGRPVNTYSARTVLDHVRRGQQQLSVASHVALPTRAAMRTAFSEMHEAFRPAGPAVVAPAGGASLHAHLSEHLFRPASGGIHRSIATAFAVSRQLAASAPGTLVTTVPNTGTAVSQFAALQTFHYRPPADQPPAGPKVDPAQVLDFHQALAALAQYPDLLRRLGLAIDLEVPESALPQSPLNTPTGKLQVMPSFAAAPAFSNYSPATAYVLDGDRIFTAAPENAAAPEFIAGFLNLALPAFDLVQVDVDSLGLKTINAIAGQALTENAADNEATDGMPASRSAGISIQRDKHADALQRRFVAAQTNERDFSAGQVTTLHAEDVTRGYRFDVLDETTGRWRSLYARDGIYAFANRPGGPIQIADEGFSQPSAAQIPFGSADQQAQLYVHESLMRWLGWSLAAPHPGLTLSETGPKAVSNEAVPGGLPLSVNFKPTPHTLPRLRYGRRYKMRARTVDLAGNSLRLEEGDAALHFIEGTLGRPAPLLPAGADGFMYHRFEPIAAPVMVARERFTEGQSLERLVIRSNHDESAAAAATRLMALVAEKRPQDKAIYLATDERHVVPPKTSQLMAEAFGLFDASIGADDGFQKSYSLARKEKGRLTDASIIDPATGQPTPIPPTSGIDPLSGGTISRPAVELVTTAANGAYAIHHEAQLHLPYLPDPLARGATLCGLPGVPAEQSGELDTQGNLLFATSTLPPPALSVVGSITRIGFSGDWPDRLPFRLALTELPHQAPPAAPTWDPAARVLAVKLGKAEEATVRLSSFMGRDDLALMGIWNWMLERNAVQGLPPPNAGDAETAEAGCVWMITPFREIKLVHAVQQPLLSPDLQKVATPRDPGAGFAYFGATAPVHGKSTAKLDLLASWQETVDRPDAPGPATVSASAHVFEVPIHLDGGAGPVDGKMPIAVYDDAHELVTFQSEPFVDVRGRFVLSRHEFGDTKHRTVDYQLVATSRFREYFPSEITDLARPGEVARHVEVPSSARPSGPKLAYALPFFEWSRTTGANGVQVRTRKRGGVRVYLERPWFSSGDGELLGIVLPNPANYPPGEDLQPFVSHWGGDPIWQSAPVPGAPTDGNYGKLFPAAVAVKPSLHLDEVPAATVFVAGHQVAFDPDRRQWACDIPIDLGPTYSPFVRLALARYQPHSLPGLELSRVVLTDFVQLANDRTVTVTPSAADANSFAVAVEGPIYRRGAWSRNTVEGIEQNPDFVDTILPPDVAAPSPVVEVKVEQRIPGAADEAGWLPATGLQVNVTSGVDAAGPQGETSLWKGQAILPAGRAKGQFRIVVREFERIPSDQREKGTAILDITDVLHHPHVRQKEAVTFIPGARRLVFAETIEL